MKQLLISLVLVFFASCGNPKEKSAIALCKEYLTVVAKDPESIKFYNVTAISTSEHDVSWNVQLDWGAKNGYGAMGRETSTFEVLGDLIIKKDGQYVSFEKGQTRFDLENRLNEYRREQAMKQKLSDSVLKKEAEKIEGELKKEKPFSFKDNPNGLNNN